jgi:hypothetical protein
MGRHIEMLDELSRETFRLSGFEKNFLSGLRRYRKNNLTQSQAFWLEQLFERVRGQKLTAKREGKDVHTETEKRMG